MTYTITDINGRTKSLQTAKGLLDELSEIANGWHEGQGSRIEKNSVELFHTKDHLALDATLNDDYEEQKRDGIPYSHRQPKSKISIKKIVEYKKIREDRGY